MSKLIKFVLTDILKNRTLLVYTGLLAALSWSVFSLEDNASKGILTLMNVILLSVPLVSIIFSTSYIYNSSEFIELLLSQPVTRSKIYLSLFGGLSMALTIAFLAGVGIPVIFFAYGTTGIMMIITGCFITLAFVAIAFLSSILTRDKAKGIGLSILLWLYFTLLFDGLVLFLLFQFSEYPVENFMVLFSAFSPVDLARILLLLQLDQSALMGYTGAIFRDFFGTSKGITFTIILLFAWVIVPFYLTLIKFKKKDL